MEEQQIQDFVHRAVTDKTMGRELARDPVSVIEKGNYSPRVVDILLRLVPYLAFTQPLNMNEKWWHA
jgi:hypothetical protein